MIEKKRRRQNLSIVIMLCIMAAALCMMLISCGGEEKNKADGSNSMKTEKTAAEEASDAASEKAESKEGKAGSKTEKNADSTKNKSKSKTESKAQNSTTASVTQAEKVCYISIEGYCSSMKISLQGSDTAYSVLKRSGALVSAESTQFGIYVNGINGKFASGDSGWKYSVNGSEPNVGADSYSISSGDTIKWYWGSAY